jgi:vacuolar protein sorting-associated protein 35
VDQVLGYAEQKSSEYADQADLHSTPTQQNLLNLLLAPLRSYTSIFTALALPHYIPLLMSQSYPTRRSVSTEFIKGILHSKTMITTAENLDRVLQVLRVLIKEGIQHPVGYSGLHSQRRGETDEIVEEQGWLARLVHLIQGPDNDTQLKVHCNSLGGGGFLVLLTLPSFFKLLERRMRKATNEFGILHQLSSPLH